MRRVGSVVIVLLFFISFGALFAGGSNENDQAVTAVENLEVTVGLVNVPNMLSPLQRTSFVMNITGNIFDTLIKRDFLSNDSNTGTGLVPGLAASWENVSPTEMVLTLRDDVLFHNGQPMTAEDAAFSLQRLFGETKMVSDELTASFEKVEVIGANQIKITTKYSDPALAAKLTSRIGRVVPKDDYLEKGDSEFALAPIGTGPYKVVEYIIDETVVLESFDEYWGGSVPLNRITFKDVPELAGRIAGLISGEFDIVSGIPTNQKQMVDAEIDFITREVIYDQVQLLSLHAGNGSPSEDIRIRRALALSIDRDFINEKLLDGAVFIPQGMQFPSQGEYYDETRISLNSYNPELAAELLAEAGYQGEEVLFQYIAGIPAGFDDVAILLTEMWQEAGINVILNPIENYTLFEYDRMSMYATSNYIVVPDQIEPLWTYWGPQGRQVQGGRFFPSEEFVSLGLKLETVQSFDERKSVYEDLLDEFDYLVPCIPLYMPSEVYGMRKDIDWTGFPDYTLYFGPGSFSVIE